MREARFTGAEGEPYCGAAGVRSAVCMLGRLLLSGRAVVRHGAAGPAESTERTLWFTFGMSLWVAIPVCLLLGFIIWKAGTAMLRSVTGGDPRERNEDPEDVEELDVFFVCTECGTEYQVTRLGKLSVPRHCGEPMVV